MQKGGICLFIYWHLESFCFHPLDLFFWLGWNRNISYNTKKELFNCVPW